MIQHFVNISGGKDSTAVYLVALSRGIPFRPIMADTGNEHPWTMEYARSLGARTGGPEVEIVKADFSDRIEKRRAYIEANWEAQGVPADLVSRALELMHPTGNPFLDLCIWKGRMPSRRAQFCTEHLKAEPIFDQIISPALDRGPVVQWLGVRRDESENRKSTPMFRRSRQPNGRSMVLFSPIIHWTAQNSVQFSIANGVDPNPLYREGMGRVGCFPCINCNKAEIASIATRFPDHIDRIAEWERHVSDVSKRGFVTFFHGRLTPRGRGMSRRGVNGGRDSAEHYPDIREVVEWSKTGRGGRQVDLFPEDDGLSCSSQYGLCE